VSRTARGAVHHRRLLDASKSFAERATRAGVQRHSVRWTARETVTGLLGRREATRTHKEKVWTLKTHHSGGAYSTARSGWFVSTQGQFLIGDDGGSLYNREGNLQEVRPLDTTETFVDDAVSRMAELLAGTPRAYN
jgi:hypothetical protein